ncbi:hypothetical protein CDD83_8004 [Cordyceps sp. RAO-2017]|nr:hypothetical protein CDD83_8004 [Cordyceps sp. RAO-2017]
MMLLSAAPKLMALVALAASASAAAVAVTDSQEHEFNQQGFIVTHNAVDYFPHAKGDLSHWDVSVRYTGYNSSMESWLTGLDPGSGASDEDRARLLLAASYAKPFDHADADMDADHRALLDAVAGRQSDALEKRNSHYIVSKAHVVVWHACSAFFSCVSGTTCSFNIDVGKAPRSRCQSQGGQNCCISWSTYKVQVGFFTRTWTNCNSEINNEHLSSASCEGKGDHTGGDVCLSNRASGCT